MGGKVMLMPEKDPSADLIMVATGTGIAPYRSFIRRLFVEKTPAGKAFKGLAWLFLGVANTDALLYDADWQKIKQEFPDNFRVDYALSREQQIKRAEKCTSRTRSRNMPMRSSSAWRRVPTCTSAVLRV